MGELARLIARTPPPAPYAVDWPSTHAALGLTLPPDYRALVETYGPGTFAETIELLAPQAPNPHYDLALKAKELDEILELRASELKGPPGRRIIPWANYLDEDWLVLVASPDTSTWPAMLLTSEELDLWPLGATATAALLTVLDGAEHLFPTLIPLQDDGFQSHR